MTRLNDVYESARINAPLARFPARDSVPPWDELDEHVRKELEALGDRTLAALTGDAAVLRSHERVIGEFNRGLCEGLLGQDEATFPDHEAASRGPFHWGCAVGRRERRGGDPDTPRASQLVNATNLLAYEFGQLEQARTRPFEFVLRNVGPERADEIGELATALPALAEYRRDLVERVLDVASFSFSEFALDLDPAPSHLEYLVQGLVALFDPDPDSWVRAAANLRLATLPFGDGTTLQTEHSAAPEEAALAVYRHPIAACTLMRRQVERIELARDWTRARGPNIELDGEPSAPVTLWSVYQMTPEARIRGGDAYFPDLVASTVIHVASAYFESVRPDEETREAFLRRHFPAFTRGFDARYEGVVDLHALASVSRGRAMSTGLRRFEGGGHYIGQIAGDLSALGKTLRELHQALRDPVRFVRTKLEAADESPVAKGLLELFERHPALPAEVFQENPQLNFLEQTHVQTPSPYDLMRSALFHVAVTVRPDLGARHDAGRLLEAGRQRLERLTRLAEERSNATAMRAALNAPEMVEMAALFASHFGTLAHLVRSIERPLYTARALARRRVSLDTGYQSVAGRSRATGSD